MKILVRGEMFRLDEFNCTVCQDGSMGYYLNCAPHNSAIFDKFKINKLELQQSILGYSDGEGSFPYCKTLEDITKYVEGIAEVVQNKKYPPKSITPDYIGTFKVDLTPKGSIVDRYATPKESYKIDVSPEAIKKDGRLRTFLLIS